MSSGKLDSVADGRPVSEFAAMDIEQEDGVKKSGNLEVMSQNLDKPEEGSIIAPDQFDSRFQTTRLEIWSYYACVANLPNNTSQKIH